jgi:hypothetical protein
MGSLQSWQNPSIWLLCKVESPDPFSFSCFNGAKNVEAHNHTKFAEDGVVVQWKTGKKKKKPNQQGWLKVCCSSKLLWKGQQQE